MDIKFARALYAAALADGATPPVQGEMHTNQWITKIMESWGGPVPDASFNGILTAAMEVVAGAPAPDDLSVLGSVLSSLETKTGLEFNGNLNVTEAIQDAVEYIASNQAPTAEANGPYTGTEGEPVAFSGAGSTDPDGTIVSYSWDFGDTNTGTGISPSHTYAEAGSYVATLTVTDDDGATGQDTASVTIEVANAWAGTHSIRSDGANEYIEVGEVAAGTSVHDPWTWSIWVKPDTVSSNDFAAFMPWARLQFASNLTYVTDEYGWIRHSSGFSQAGVWNHYLFEFLGAGTRVRCYKNGVYIATGTTGGVVRDRLAGDSMYLAGPGTSSNHYDGLLCEFAWWNQTLTTAEKAAVYNGGVRFDLRTAVDAATVPEPASYVPIVPTDDPTIGFADFYGGTCTGHNYEAPDLEASTP